MAHTLMFEVLAPFTPEQRDYPAQLLQSWRTADYLQQGLDDEDRAALEQLTDPTSGAYALGHNRCYVVHTATVYVGQA
jgi:hypothetical protein